MPNNVITPTTALIVIDLQEGLAQMPAAHNFREIALRAGELADAFRQVNLPVVLVNVSSDGAGSTEFVAELRQRDSDHVVTKSQRSAFHDETGLADILNELDIKDVVVVGYATSIGVEATFRDAVAIGLNPIVATDAMTDFTYEAHDRAVDDVFTDLGFVTTTTEIIAALPHR